MTRKDIGYLIIIIIILLLLCYAGERINRLEQTLNTTFIIDETIGSLWDGEVK